MAGAFVDRIEGDVAVLIAGGRQRRAALGMLPAGVRAGDWLSEDLTRIEPAERERVQKEIAERRERLTREDDGGDFGLP